MAKNIKAGAMDLSLEDSRYYHVKDIEIPEVFFRRFKTGISALDKVFGEGFLPGMAFTIDAQAGTGKTTMLLQVLNQLALGGMKTAYVSGEESKEQLAFTCARLGVENVTIANKTNVDEIASDIEKYGYKFLVIDSFQCMRTENIDGTRGTETYVVNKLCKTAKQNECVIGFIMHRTKQGKLKGGSNIPHTVDMNMALDQGDEEIYGTDQVRVLSVYKNRFGSTGETEFEMTASGLNFAYSKPEFEKGPSGPKNNGKARDQAALIQKATEGRLTAGDATEITGNFYRGKNAITELVVTGRLRKVGRGGDAYWVAM